MCVDVVALLAVFTVLCVLLPYGIIKNNNIIIISVSFTVARLLHSCMLQAACDPLRFHSCQFSPIFLCAKNWHRICCFILFYCTVSMSSMVRHDTVWLLAFVITG